eukprot:SAG11_NODE_662_length_7875_cov_17.557613_1_plen_152_part_00
MPVQTSPAPTPIYEHIQGFLLDHRGRVNDYAFADEFDDFVGLFALEEYERHTSSRKSVVGSETPTDSGRQGLVFVRGSTVGVVGGGSAGGGGGSGATEDPAFEMDVSEEEEDMWKRALDALEEDETLALDRAELDDLMRDRVCTQFRRIQM